MPNGQGNMLCLLAKKPKQHKRSLKLMDEKYEKILPGVHANNRHAKTQTSSATATFSQSTSMTQPPSIM
jgi:hypothetical protein